MDLRTLRALKGAPISCYGALQILAHAGISDLCMATGYDKDTVIIAARLLLMLGVARRDGVRGDYSLIEKEGSNPAPAEFSPAIAEGEGGRADGTPAPPEETAVEAGSEVEKIDHLARSSSGSSSLYLPIVKQSNIKTTTTTTTVLPEVENIDLRDTPVDSGIVSGASGSPPAGAEPSRTRLAASAEASLPPETRRIADFLVKRAACPRNRAVEAVAEALRAGEYPAWVELQILYWSVYVWSERAKGIQNPGAFVAARIAEGAPAPTAVSLQEWGDRDLEMDLKVAWDNQDAVANPKAEDAGSSTGWEEEDGSDDTAEEGE